MADSNIEFMPKDLFDFPDPYPMFAGLRQSQPICHVKQFGRETWMVTRYDDVAAVLRDGDTFSSSANSQLQPVMGRTIIEMDGAEHQKHRRIVQHAFHFKSIAAVEEHMVETVDHLLDRFAGEGRADLVSQFAETYPLRVIARIAGVPIEDFELFKQYALDIIGFTMDLERGIQASRAIRDYLLPLIARRRDDPADDVLSRLATAEIDGERLTDEEIVSFMRLLLPAGAETTFRLIGSTLFALLGNRAAFEEVLADRTLLPAAIEETLRWETPIVLVGRRTTRATELSGVAIPEGAMLTPVIGSANRDEAHYDDPDRWDLHRGADDHLSFGGGRHFCLGYHLAKLEARIAIDSILARLEGLHLDPDHPSQIVGLAFRSPRDLWVRFERG